MNNNSMEQPDPDNIKMFVGQVPHDLSENDLRTLFEEFGRVHQINILRDKETGSHKVQSDRKTAARVVGNSRIPKVLLTVLITRNNEARMAIHEE
ncbi:hypothetical protein KM043_005408 [Ampulex compressa]|nr:hypothetical protein KM043_005408 [Ampulex compressa]